LKKVLIVLMIVMASYSAVHCAEIYYDDPISVGIGARPISMGRAFVAIADDANAMFLNPAGLGFQKKWYLTSMNTNFLNEYQYMMFSGVNPTPNGTVGIGYVSSRIGGIDVSGGGSSDFYNQAIVLSYGRYVGDLLAPSLGEEQNMYAGLSFKHYDKGFTGSINAIGTGYNLDLGLLYAPEKWISYGLNLQNVLYGSKISGDFDPETIPFITKIGVAYNWLEYNVTFALDKDMFLSRANVPWPNHLGAEWKVIPSLSLRAGYDQVASSGDGGDLVGNTTLGVGLDLSGVQIDLAYMQNYAQTGISSNIVSVSFYSQPIFAQAAPPKKEEAVPGAEVAAPAPQEVTPPPPAPVVAAPVVAAPVVSAPPPKKVGQKITINPPGNLYTQYADLTISGAIDFDVTDVWIDAKKLEIRSDRIFVESIPLSIGKNERTIRVKDTSGAESKIVKKIVRFYVPTNMAFEEATSKNFEYKAIYTELYRFLGKDYNTSNELSRGAMALILAKAKKLNMVTPQAAIFKDVTYLHWAATFIKAVTSAGFMAGYKDGTFKPDQTVTRKELAFAISKAANIDEGTVMGYMSGKSTGENVTFGDLIEVIYYSEMFRKEIDDYQKYLGPESSMI